MVSLTSKTGKFISVLVNVDKISGSLFLFESEMKIDFESIITQEAIQRKIILIRSLVYFLMLLKTQTCL
ncbi:hypothetical protein CWS02_20075 [Enterobacter sp. EA-1]|nr:hypothetical protein CWS02_20075 [Enterobacter sp. EA-1]